MEYSRFRHETVRVQSAQSSEDRRRTAGRLLIPRPAAAISGAWALTLLSVTMLPKPAAVHQAAAAKPASQNHAPAPSPPLQPSPPSKPAGGYGNPLAHARVKPERIDQGVDYAGTGTLTSIGKARVKFVGISGTGWPGAFIEYRLLNGPDAGRYVYYAEGVRPAGRISVGRIVQAGQAVAHLIPLWPTGIEIGWGAGIGTETLAAKRGQHTFPTTAGKRFSALIASLGGPPGKK